MAYFRKKIFGPLLQDDNILGGVTSEVMGVKKISNACSGLPTYRHNYCKMLEFANKKFVKINPPYSANLAAASKRSNCSVFNTCFLLLPLLPHHLANPIKVRHENSLKLALT
jgi:hypothetical protein